MQLRLRERSAPDLTYLNEREEEGCR